jgi:hypothetical protein
MDVLRNAERGDVRCVVHAALSLREWAVAAFGGGAGWEHAPPATPRAWEVFLTAEQCALPLRALLGPATESLGGEKAGRVQELATRAQQRYLVAGGQARRLGRWAAAAGVPLVVLKGGLASVQRGPLVGMADLDVLVPASGVERLAHHLDALGFRSAGGTTSMDAHGHHLVARMAPSSVHVEIHHRLPEMAEPADLIARARPIPGVLGLLRLSPSDHLTHLLVHSGAQHLLRRGALRDLVLLAHAWAEASSGERAIVAGNARDHPFCDALSSLLTIGGELLAGSDTADPFRAEAAIRYAVVARAGRSLVPAALRRTTLESACALVGPPGEYSRFWRRTMRREAWRAPGSTPGGLVLRAARAARLLATAALALRTAREATRALRLASAGRDRSGPLATSGLPVAGVPRR